MSESITIEQGFQNAETEGLPSEYASEESMASLVRGCQGNALAHLWKEHDVDGAQYSDIRISELRVYVSGGKEIVEYIAHYEPDA